VGNDVVDLTAPQARGKSLRHMQKILTDDELQMVLGSDLSHPYLWMFWAAKESAFKALKKSFCDISFSPKQYSAAIDLNTNRGVVVSPHGSVYVRIEMNKNWVHCIGVTGNAVFHDFIKSGIETIDHSIPTDDCFRADIESMTVRRAARNKLAQYLKVKTDDIDIIRSKDQTGKLLPPALKINGKNSDIDFSLSHDGRFIAYCFL
jgi:phosphopantetheinyl transferase (holo-ACP synthase)